MSTHLSLPIVKFFYLLTLSLLTSIPVHAMDFDPTIESKKVETEGSQDPLFELAKYGDNKAMHEYGLKLVKDKKSIAKSMKGLVWLYHSALGGNKESRDILENYTISSSINSIYDRYKQISSCYFMGIIYFTGAGLGPNGIDDKRAARYFDRVIEAEKPSPGMTQGVAFLIGGRKHVFSLPTFHSVDERDDASKDGVPDLLVKYMDDSKYLRAHLGATSTDTELRLGERQILELLSNVDREDFAEFGKSSKEDSVKEILSRAKQKNGLNTLRTMIYTAKGRRLTSSSTIEDYLPSRPLVRVSIAAPGEPTQGVYMIFRGDLCNNLECDGTYLLNNKGKTKVCTKCNIAHYCSTTCQNADWNSHKEYCRAKRVRAMFRSIESAEKGIDLKLLEVAHSAKKKISEIAKALSRNEVAEEDLEVSAGNSGESNSTNDNKETTTPEGRACDNCGAKASDTLKLKVCGFCQKVRYCSQECQKKAWKAHKLLCNLKPKASLD